MIFKVFLVTGKFFLFVMLFALLVAHFFRYIPASICFTYKSEYGVQEELNWVHILGFIIKIINC